jgi:hypothetical protein
MSTTDCHLHYAQCAYRVQVPTPAPTPQKSQILTLKKIVALFTFMWPRTMTNFLIIKSKTCTNFSNLFWNETLHVSDSSSAHQELFTLYSGMVYVIKVCRQLSSRIRMELVLILLEICLQICMTYTIAGCTVNNSWWWTEELSETCRVSFPK